MSRGTLDPARLLSGFVYEKYAVARIWCFHVLFVERSGELFVVARLSTRRYEAEGKPSLNRASLVAANRPETG